MNQVCSFTRRHFIKLAGAATAVAMSGLSMVRVASAAAMDFVAKRQASVYATDADKKVYKLRKSQENPMIQKIYAKDGFLADGPCGHKSHELLHTHYIDRSAGLKALKAKGLKFKV